MLLVQANNVLLQPATRVLLECYFSSSFPLNLTNDETTTAELDGLPVRLSTEDLYVAPAPFNGALFRAGIVTEPSGLQQALLTQLETQQRIEEVHVEIANPGGIYNTWFTDEVRGKLAVLHLYQAIAQELIQNVFVGQLAAFSFGEHTIAVTLTSTDLQILQTIVPIRGVDTDVFPHAQDVGTKIAQGQGIGERIPGRYVNEDLANARYDYIFCSGNASLQRIRRGDKIIWGTHGVQGGPFSVGTEGYERLYREYIVAGTFCTAIRFREPQTTPITADIERLYPDIDHHTHCEWKWDVGFRADVTPIDAIPHGAIADASRTYGPTVSVMPGTPAHGIGAIQFPGGSGDYVDLPGVFFSDQTLTVQIDLNVGASEDARDGLVFASRWAIPHTTAGTARGWWLWVDVTGGGINLEVRLKGVTNGLQTGSIPLAYSTWHRITVRIDPTASGIRFRVTKDDDVTNEVELTEGTAIQFDSAAGLPYAVLGKAWSTQAEFIGRIGCVRADGIARGDDWVRESYWLQQRNAFALAHELFRDAQVEMDLTTLRQAAIDWQAVEQGKLKCDGYITEAIPLQDVLPQLQVLRDLRFPRGPDGLIQAHIAQPLNQVEATFGAGTGSQWDNIVAGELVRTRASLAEAIRQLPVQYRPRRDRDGTFQTFAHTITRDVLDVGRIAEPVTLSFVYEHVAADIVASFLEKRLRTRDERLDFPVAHEGRFLQVAQAIRVDLPHLGIVLAEYEILAVAHRVQTLLLGLSPYDADVFDWTPSASLPTDVPMDLSLALEVGNAAAITTIPTGTGVSVDQPITIHVNLDQAETLRPTANGTLLTFDGAVGAGSAAAAVTDADGTDDDTTYIYAALNVGERKRASFPHDAMMISDVFTDIVDVTVWVRAAIANAGEAVDLRPLLYVEGQLISFGVVSHLVDATSYAWFTHTLPSNMLTGRPFTREELNAAEVAVEVRFVSGVSTVKVSTIYLAVTTRAPVPRDWGTTKVWRVGPYAHPQSPVPDPLPGAQPFHVAAQLRGIEHLLPLAASGSGNRYYFVAVIADQTGRHSRTITGPDGIEVT